MEKTRIIKGVLGKFNYATLSYEFSKIEFEHKSYKDMYTLLDIQFFEIPSMYLGNKEYDIYCDEEGQFNALKDFYSVAYGKKFKQVKPYIVGNVFICSHTADGDIASLTDAQCERVLNSTIGNMLWFD